jgi:hypothetical protein
VHLGDSNPRILWKNLERSRKLFPGIEHEVILSSDRLINRAKKIGVKAFKYSVDQDVSNALGKHGLNHEFRNGFWRFSLERLFAITQYFETNSDHPVLHIESDVLLLPNFPWSKFSSLNKPAWFNFNETHDVASIIYIPNQSSAIWLKMKMLQVLESHLELTDMTLLSKISRNYSGEIEILPTAGKTNSRIFRDEAIGSEDKRRISALTREFKGYFDSAPIGMWLIGQDPHNHFGRTFLHMNLAESFIQPQRISYSLNTENGALSESESGLPIFSLHIHSKNIKLFGRNWVEELAKFIGLSEDPAILQFWSPLATLRTIAEVFKRHRWNLFAVLIKKSLTKLKPY